MKVIHALTRRLAALALLAVSFAVLLAGPALAQSSQPDTRGLTGRQEATVLRLIDQICGDTWCEGDFRYDFRTFSCDAAHRTCRLTLRLAPYTDEAPHWYRRAGTVHGFVRFSQMVRTAANGGQSLVPEFYDAVNTLINQIETTVPAAGPGRAVGSLGRVG